MSVAVTLGAGRQAVALLIDADNLSAAGMERALDDLRDQGLVPTVLRAYGSLETLTAARPFLQRHGGKAIVNHGVGTTDAALVVDAMDLLHAGHLPGTVAIGSGDGDFAPLAVRLREAGHQVLCFAQRSKAAVADLQRVYASVSLVDEAREAEAVAPAPRARGARKTAPAAASPRKAPQKAAASKAKAAPAGASARSDTQAEVLAVLESIPALHRGESVALNDVVKKLRDAGLMGKSAGASSFFKRHGLPVQLMPARQPNEIRLLRERDA